MDDLDRSLGAISFTIPPPVGFLALMFTDVQVWNFRAIWFAFQSCFLPIFGMGGIVWFFFCFVFWFFWFLFRSHTGNPPLNMCANQSPIHSTQGSTRQWEAQPEAMAAALSIHNNVIRSSFLPLHGYEVKTGAPASIVLRCLGATARACDTHVAHMGHTRGIHVAHMGHT